MENASEVGLTKILEYSKGKSIAIIPASKYGCSRAEYGECVHGLGRDLVHAGYGFFTAECEYREFESNKVGHGGAIIAVCSKEQNFETFKEIMIALAKTFEQDRVIIKKFDGPLTQYSPSRTFEEQGEWRTFADVGSTILKFIGKEGNLKVSEVFTEPYKMVNHISAMGVYATRKRILNDSRP